MGARRRYSREFKLEANCYAFTRSNDNAPDHSDVRGDVDVRRGNSAF